MKCDSTLSDISFLFWREAGKGNRLGDLAKKWHGARVGTAARTHELPFSPRSNILFVCLSLPLSLSPSSRVAVFVDCSPTVVIVTVMQTARAGCLSAWICQVCMCVCVCVCVCVCLIKPQSALSLERKCLENYVMSSFFKKKGEKVKKKKREEKNPICPCVRLSASIFLSVPGECSVYECRHAFFSMCRKLSVDILTVRILYCLFL